MSNTLSKLCLDRKTSIIAAARSSPLSRVQVDEIAAALALHHPEWKIEPLWIETSGDKDQKTSLRDLGKTDFFTREIDQILLNHQSRIGIHSAKDLPDPLPGGLEIVAITEGVDPSDSVVFRDGDSLETLSLGAKIAASSTRREEIIKRLRPDLTFVDLRGTIGVRLSQLWEKQVDGVVVAEAALIRLKLTHLCRMRLPGETVVGQGQLAVIAREGDREMQHLFSCLDSRERILYLGLRCPKGTLRETYLPCPIIQTLPCVFTAQELDEMSRLLPKTTHWLFTSQTAVQFFFDCLPSFGLPHGLSKDKIICAVGKKTAKALGQRGLLVDVIAQEESAEGLIQALEKLPLDAAYFFWPHSALSRSLLNDYCVKRGWQLFEKVLYHTRFLDGVHLPESAEYDTIFFTSPSTVEAFLDIFGALPRGKTMKTIGPITAKKLSDYLAG